MNMMQFVLNRRIKKSAIILITDALRTKKLNPVDYFLSFLDCLSQ